MAGGNRFNPKTPITIRDFKEEVRDQRVKDALKRGMVIDKMGKISENGTTFYWARMKWSS